MTHRYAQRTLALCLADRCARTVSSHPTRTRCDCGNFVADDEIELPRHRAVSDWERLCAEFGDT